MSERLVGWGGTAPAHCDVVRPRDEEAVVAALSSKRPVLARGLGRSYGDAAQVSGGLVVDLTEMNSIGPVGADGTVRLGAGASVQDLLSAVMPQGWFIPVTPGTRLVTMGGAIAADVHGKNHHVDGSFARHVRSMRLVTPTGAFEVSPERDPDLFWATMGAMGLTGLVTELTLALTPIETDQVLVDTERFGDLQSLMAAMADEPRRYSVAWVDCMTTGRHLGRAVLTRGDHATRADLPTATLEAPRAARVRVPLRAPSGLLNALSVRAFNEAWYRKAPKHREAEAQSIGTFFHPLDGIADWNLLYGKRGFVQYQFVVPLAATRSVERAIELLARSGVASFLAVLKKFGPGDPGPLSFPMEGWTLALDLPLGQRDLARTLDDLDQIVLEAGGRVYLAKDARLEPRIARAMYPRLAEFAVVKNRVDPEGRLTSDLARRLDLVGT